MKIVYNVLVICSFIYLGGFIAGVWGGLFSVEKELKDVNQKMDILVDYVERSNQRQKLDSINEQIDCILERISINNKQ